MTPDVIEEVEGKIALVLGRGGTVRDMSEAAAEVLLGRGRGSMDKTGFRKERIEKLLHELRYEVERGMMEREIDEEMSFSFLVPLSRCIPDGVVHCEFKTRPIPRYHMHPDDLQPRLRVVK